MKFCRKCGAEIEEKKSFCTKCGNPVSMKSKVSNECINATKQKSSGQPFKNSNKKQNILLIAVVVILILGIGSFSIGSLLTSKKNVVSKFTKAITTNNSEQFAKYITCSDTKLKIEADKLDNLLKYLNENTSYRDEVIRSIEDQSLKISSKSNSNSNSSEDYTNNLFTLKKQGKTGIFFDNYVFEIKPAYIKVSTNYSGTEIYLSDKLMYTTDQQDSTKEIGPYFPGIYNMKAVLKGEYVNLEKSSEVDLIKSHDQSIKVSLYLEGYTPAIDCDYQDAKIFANGKDTGIEVKDAKKFGPVSKDGSVKIYAQKEFPWGVVKGEEAAINGDGTIKLKLSGINDDLQENIMTTMNSIDQNWCVAVTLRDPSKLVNLSEKMKQKLTNDIEQMVKDKKYYTGDLKKTVFDLNSFKIYMKDNKYYAEFKDEETYYGTYYNEGAMPEKVMDSTIWIYTMVYDDISKQWLQDGVEEGSSIDRSNKKEFDF